MDPHDVEKGSSVDRTRDGSAAAPRTVLIPRRRRGGPAVDASAVARLAERARTEDRTRTDRVADAVQKLQNGDLASEAAISETARRLLQSRFLGA